MITEDSICLNCGESNPDQINFDNNGEPFNCLTCGKDYFAEFPIRSCKGCASVEVCYVSKYFVELIETSPMLFENTTCIDDAWIGIGNNCKQYLERDVATD